MRTQKMSIKKGDTVKVLSGKDAGKTGKVLAAFPKNFRLTVEGVNVHTKFEKSKRAGQPGTKVTFSAPMHSSKVQLVDPASGKPTRVGTQVLESGKKQRIAKVSGKAI